MITYATNNPSNGYEFMISGEAGRFDLTKYTHVWVYDPEFDDEPPDWTRFPMETPC